jgi:hypothetical protein
MNSRRLAPLFVALLLLACEIPAGLTPLFAAPSAPTLDDFSLNAIVAQTAAAAASLTAAAPIDTVVPTVTSWPTATLLITTTPSPVPSLTPTFIFLLPTATKPKPTATATATKPSSGGGTAGGDYNCQVLSQEPADDTKFSSNADFDGKWRVRNTGDRKWDENSADYRYQSGDKFHVESIYDFWKTVAPGEQITLTVDMKAPKKVGTYTTRWEIRIGQNHFCRVEMTIQVK